MISHKQISFLIIKFLCIFTSAFSQQINDDCEILSRVLNSEYNEKSYLSRKKLYNRFINIAKELKQAEKNKNFRKIDSIKKEGKISKKIENLYPIFNIENYDYFISQEKKTSTRWDTKTCNSKWKFHNEKGREIDISKPIYSKNYKYALVTIRQGFAYYILILLKENGFWKEGHILFFCFYDKKTNDCFDSNNISL